MQHTQNYNLNLFESGDPVLAESFNTNTEIIAGELAKRLRCKAFSYVGSGDSLHTETFESRPLLIVIWDRDSNLSYRVGVACYGQPYMAVHWDAGNSSLGHMASRITWTENGFSLETDTLTMTESFNTAGKHYTCLAFLE